MRFARSAPSGKRTTRERREARQQARRALVGIAAAESRAALTARVTTEPPVRRAPGRVLVESSLRSAGAKILVAPLAGSYEREAIRPHVLGRFEDMVLASAKHPAMLVYLDNFQSIGPSSRGAQLGRGAAAQRGLNENYARELLELHTLGVDGGYTQQDVQELAKILTGWTVGGLARRRGGSAMQAAARARRRRRVPREADDVTAASDSRFRSCCTSPAIEDRARRAIRRSRRRGGRARDSRARAATHRPRGSWPTKLVTHFVARRRRPRLRSIASLASFRDTDGDLRAVVGALIDLPEAWGDGARKFRTPQDWLVAVLRAFDAQRR